jgi:hypothetical protein
MTAPLPGKALAVGQPPTVWPNTLREINDLPEPTKLAIYYTLLPDWPFTRFGIDRETLSVDGKPVVNVRALPSTRSMEMTVKHRADAEDPLVYLHMVDTFNYQLMVLLLVVNDPDSPRFNVDVDATGRSTNLGTTNRNIPEEVRAMQYGLAPAQVRSGLRVFRQGVPVFEAFVHNMGKDLFLIEPLAYHNAISFERYGFAYIRGRKDMEAIHAGFQPGGELYARLDGSTPFRHPDAWKTVRGRSWAIHDGILGHPFTGFQMYKRIGQHAGVSTFPDSAW